jgi:hypothetical protein
MLDVAYFKVLSKNFLERLRKTTETAIRIAILPPEILTGVFQIRRTNSKRSIEMFCEFLCY